MMNINFDTYEMICDLLDNEDLDVAEIAAMVGVSVETVKYVDRAENDIF
jgi:DNA-directed RNA polymerase specialized sigma24 family protein